jgi:hypothetical protein
VSARLVQLLLPLVDNEGRRYPADLFASLRRMLVERFGGATAYVRSPAEGFWTPVGGGPESREDVVLVEVMDVDFDPAWWRACRLELERTLRQQAVVIRALPMESL